MDRTRQIWEELGEKDAYFAVATYEEFRQGNLDAAAKERFFQTGRDHIEKVWTEIENNFSVELNPERSLDYGCGVGRVLVPLAGRSKTAVGVDISGSMLAEARKNCNDLKNIVLQNPEQFMNDAADKYDFVHSFVVLQHVAPRLGLDIIRKILHRLKEGGVGMIHVTFRDTSPRFRAIRAKIYRDIPFAHRLVSLMRGKTARFMPMYEYDLNSVFQIFEENMCGDIFVRFTDHGFKGGMIFFRKSDGRSW